MALYGHNMAGATGATSAGMVGYRAEPYHPPSSSRDGDGRGVWFGCSSQPLPTSSIPRGLFPPSNNVSSSKTLHTAPNSVSVAPENAPVVFVGMTLRRQNILTRWGITLSLFEENFLMVGHVDPSVSTMTRWARVTCSLPETSVCYDSFRTSQDDFRAAFQNGVMEAKGTQQLLAGDWILSIDGRAISSFGSLSSITTYLRHATELSLVVARHEAARQQAHAVLTSNPLWESNPDQSCMAAYTAYQVIRSALQDSSKQIVSHHPAPLSFDPVYVPRHNVQTGQLSVAQPPQTPGTGIHTFSKPPSTTSSYTQTTFASTSTPQKGASITQDFQGWLASSKNKWRRSRSARRAAKIPSFSFNGISFPSSSLSGETQRWRPTSTTAKRRLVFHEGVPPVATGTTQICWRNPLFCDEQGDQLLFSDSDYEFDPEEGSRAKHFLVQVDTQSFPSWLSKRKEAWRKNWKTYQIDDDDSSCYWDEQDSNVAHDFWLPQGFLTFEHWLLESTTKWKRSYSWNQRKRRRIEKESVEVVHFPSGTNVKRDEAVDQMQRWLRVRKNQWRILRRKRQRQREEEESTGARIDLEGKQELEAAVEAAQTVTNHEQSAGPGTNGSPSSVSSKKLCAVAKSSEMLCIDALLEEEELRRKAVKDRPPFVISFIFDARLGAPDDTIAHCLRFLHPSEHGKLLCISATTSRAIRLRDHMWRQMCPTHWTLPRRPRKPWHELYITKIRTEEELARKRSDDILLKAANLLFKGDNIHQIQKLVNGGENRFRFHVNYISGVVCERNSMLNLAVIHGRHKTVRWLVETKGADIESSDRGNFTPLMNASWAGDKYLVRFFLSKGSNRRKIGTGHYSQPLAPPEFKGLTAEGWARKRGHTEIGDLIHVGL